MNGRLPCSVFATGTLCWLSAVAAAGTFEPESILDAIIWIEEQASRIESGQGNFTVRYLPTSDEEMQRISALCRYRGNEHRASTYQVSARRARRRNYYSAWWRAGVKERQEKTHITRPAIVETTVFDGQAVKTLDGTPGRTCLYIASPETHWTYKSRVQAFAFAFEYRSSPHGTILRRSAERSIVRRRFGDEDRSVVTALHPSDDRLVLRMVFDEQRRLVQRDAILTRSSSFLELDNEAPAVYSRWEFSNFRPYDDGRGGYLWFPTNAILRYYLGTLPDGTLVQSRAMQIEVGDIEFNVEVPDEKFELHAPDGVPVRDLRSSRYSTIGVSY